MRRYPVRSARVRFHSNRQLKRSDVDASSQPRLRCVRAERRAISDAQRSAVPPGRYRLRSTMLLPVIAYGVARYQKGIGGGIESNARAPWRYGRSYEEATAVDVSYRTEGRVNDAGRRRER